MAKITQQGCEEKENFSFDKMVSIPRFGDFLRKKKIKLIKCFKVKASRDILCKFSLLIPWSKKDLFQNRLVPATKPIMREKAWIKERVLTTETFGKVIELNLKTQSTFFFNVIPSHPIVTVQIHSRQLISFVLLDK